MTYAAYLGSCSANKDLVCQLLGLEFTREFMLVGEVIARRTFLHLSVSTTFDSSLATQTILQSTLDDLTYSNLLSQYSIRDRACLLALSNPFGYACAWLQVLPSLQLGLAILLLNLLWPFAFGWGYLYFQRHLFLSAVVTNLLTVLETTLLAVAMVHCISDVIMLFVTSFILLC